MSHRKRATSRDAAYSVAAGCSLCISSLTAMSDPCEIPGIEAIAGPPLIGYLINWGLFGVISIQVYLYYLAFPTDILPLKCLVVTIYSIEAAQTFMLTNTAFNMFAYGYGDLNALNTIGTTWISIAVFGAISACIVQTFYAWRVMMMSGRRRFFIVITSLAWISMGASLACGVLMERAVYFSNLQNTKMPITAGIWMGSGAACNVVIAVSMTYYLKKRVGNAKTTQVDIVAENIIRFTVESGAVTAAVSVILLALGVTYLASRPRYYQALATTLVKLYATALMVLLNGRMKLGSTAHPATWNDSEIDVGDAPRSRRGTVSTGVHDMSAEAYSKGVRQLRDSDVTAVDPPLLPSLGLAAEGKKGSASAQVQHTTLSTSGACADGSDDLVESLPLEESPSERSRGEEVSRPDSPILP
ncbi:hypothetical protein HYPSUDRAFT_39507 [Hypholoma sublateritium FD-334 SS-4]|uniref:DUF6534 domain-containing protein n=1 Tax=Hypholoma sublateritium (strain FD-334 SS-4) TaxID=945553 RepID=A0A0D2NY40_HYPSF|nr:hypothetical protein HYPSUDRAFT_39507 [Hypholoma sublateritium FD-334 SS-4]